MRRATCLTGCVPTRLGDRWSKGCEFREGLNAVGISGGVAGNVVPGECVVTVNYRFAPDGLRRRRRPTSARCSMGSTLTVTDICAGSAAWLGSTSRGAGFLAAVGGEPRERSSAGRMWRCFSALGVPAVNFGPGDPNVAHTAGSGCRRRRWSSARRHLSRVVDLVGGGLTPFEVRRCTRYGVHPREGQAS